MTDKRSCSVFFAVTAAHFMLLTLFITRPSNIEPPVSLQIMQGVLVSVRSPESVTTPRAKAPPRPVPKAAPVRSSLPIPVNAPPSERAITVPPAEPVPDTQSESKPVSKSLQFTDRSAQPSSQQEPSADKSLRSGPDTSGEPLVLPRVDAGHLKNPAPNYPPVSRRVGEQGQVLLDVLILADGTVGDIKLKTSSRHTRLDNAALDAVKRWRYQPARRGNTPIAYWYVQPIIFTLKS